MTDALAEHIGFVAIGRNEGERIGRCIDSLTKHSSCVIYVDSSSEDDSVAIARSCGAKVLQLSSDKPFTAARARNEGAVELNQHWPDTEFIMFIDGDCELIGGFVSTAVDLLRCDPEVVIVTGRCKEKYPDATIYNRICDMEWNGPIGDIDACGGIFVIRKKAFETIEGFNATLVAGEEPELCMRLGKQDLRIHRVNKDMCFHDADMKSFGQWWRRAVRAGVSYAQVSDIHKDAYQAEQRRAWLWGAVLPTLILVAAPLTFGVSFVLISLYAVSFWKTRRDLIRNGAAPRHAALHAAFLVLSKFPNLAGMLSYHLKRFRRRPVRIIEYK